MVKNLLRLAAALSLLVPALPAVARTPPFVSRVRQNFAHWDLNHDGKISADELARLVQEADIHGLDAAALATLKHFSVRPGIEITPALLDEYEAQFARNDSHRTAFTRFYDTYRGKISSAERRLMAGEVPHRTAIHQGPDGDCYFLAAVGSMIARDPQEIVQIIASNPDGSYTVTFPNQEPVRVDPPTDAEVALYDNSLDDGVWLFLLEKAYGLIRVSHNRKFQSTIEAFDATGGKGSARDSIKMLTGRDTWLYRFDHHAYGDQRSQRLVALRDRLVGALEAHELLTVRTDLNDPTMLPFKVPHMHVWTVLDYDRGSDRVTLWNPWGHELKPLGTDNLMEGYPTHQGVLKVSMEEFFTFWWGLIGEKSQTEI